MVKAHPFSSCSRHDWFSCSARSVPILFKPAPSCVRLFNWHELCAAGIYESRRAVAALISDIVRAEELDSTKFWKVKYMVLSNLRVCEKYVAMRKLAAWMLVISVLINTANFSGQAQISPIKITKRNAFTDIDDKGEGGGSGRREIRSQSSKRVKSTISVRQFTRQALMARASYFENEILRAAAQEAVDPFLLWTIAYNETRFRPWLTSPKNAQGLMQFIPATARRFDLANPYDSTAAIHAAARYTRYLLKSFGHRIDSVLAAYNAGEGAVNAYLTGKSLAVNGKIINPQRTTTAGGVPPYAETRGYVGRGLKVYRWLVATRGFPANYRQAFFPDKVDRKVAMIALNDPELQTRTQEIQPVILDETTASFARPTPTERPLADDAQPAQNPLCSVEVYYDARSGNRYLLSGGEKRKKLADRGPIVIGNNTRPEVTNRARSTYFPTRGKK